MDDDSMIDWSKSVPHGVLGSGTNVIFVESNPTCPPGIFYLLQRRRMDDFGRLDVHGFEYVDEP